MYRGKIPVYYRWIEYGFVQVVGWTCTAGVCSSTRACSAFLPFACVHQYVESASRPTNARSPIVARPGCRKSLTTANSESSREKEIANWLALLHGFRVRVMVRVSVRVRVASDAAMWTKEKVCEFAQLNKLGT